MISQSYQDISSLLHSLKTQTEVCENVHAFVNIHDFINSHNFSKIASGFPTANTTLPDSRISSV